MKGPRPGPAAWPILFMLALSAGVALAQDCSPCGSGVEDCIAAENGEICAECDFPGAALFLLDTDGDGFGACAACDACGDGHYIKTPCSGVENTVCEACSICADGEMEVEPCAATTDTVCEAAPAEVAQAEETIEDSQPVAFPAVEEVNISSADCSACPEGDFLVSECDETNLVDRICRACIERCGEGVTDCIADGNGDAACPFCNFPGFEMYTEDADGDGYGECKFCSPCDDDEFVEEACIGFEDNKCAKCSECGDGEEVAEACTSTKDTVCAAPVVVDCSACADGEFIVATCDVEAGTDRTCGACTECGSGEWLKTACSRTVDAECVACSECGDGELQVSACSAIADSVCMVAPAETVSTDPAEEEVVKAALSAKPVQEEATTTSPAKEEVTATGPAKEDVTTTDPALEEITTSDPIEEVISTDPVEENTADDAVEEEVIATVTAEEEITATEPAGEEVIATVIAEEEITADEPIEEVTATTPIVEVISTDPVEVKITADTPVEDEVLATVAAGEEITATEPAEEEVTVAVPADEEEVTADEPADEEVTVTDPVEEVIATDPITEQTTATDPNTEEIETTEPAEEEVVTTDPIEEEITTTDPNTEEIIATEPAEEEVIATDPVEEEIVTARLAEEVTTTNTTEEVVATSDPAEPVEEKVPTVNITQVEVAAEEKVAGNSTDCSACPEGDFLVSECDEANLVDRVCRACIERCGEGVTDCIADGNGDAACPFCNFPGYNLYTEDVNGDGYGECKFCSLCDDDEFVEVGCFGFEDNKCAKCSECGDGEVEVEACTATTDTVCAAVIAGPPPLITKSTTEEGTLRMTIAAGEGLDELYRVAFVYKGDHFDSGDLSSPSCNGPDADSGETVGVEDAPVVLDFDSQWTALAVRLCPKESTGVLQESPVTRAIYSACSCFGVQYVSAPCNATSGAVAQCEFCSQCTDGQDGSMAQCRGGGVEDCLTCGGEGGELNATDGEYGQCSFVSGGAEGGGEGTAACENVCEEGYFIETPCAADTPVVCKECTSCEIGGVQNEAKSCNNTALEGGDRTCGNPLDALFPIAQPMIDLEDNQTAVDALFPVEEEQAADLEDNQTAVDALFPVEEEQAADLEDNQTAVDALFPVEEEQAADLEDNQTAVDALFPVEEEQVADLKDNQTAVDALFPVEDELVADLEDNQTAVDALFPVVEEPVSNLEDNQTAADLEGSLVIEERSIPAEDPVAFAQPAVLQVWTDSNELQVVVEGMNSDAAEVRFALWAIESSGDLEEAEAFALTCDNATSPNSTESGAISAGDLESFLFSTNAVVFVRAIACPVGFADGLIQPSSEVAMEMSLCACAPGKGLALSCDETAKTTASCAECGIGTFLDETESVCVACSSECAAGSFQTASCTAASDISCEPCSTCGSGELEVTACTAESDTVCAPAGTPQPVIVKFAADSNALEAGQPPMQASVQLPLGYPSSEWYVKYTAQVAEEYTNPEDVLASPVCDGEPSPGPVDAVNQLWNAGYGYGWVLVRAVTCPVDASSQQEASAVVSEAISMCSCAAGQYPTASCNILEGEKVQCETCPDSGCPPAVKPPLLSQMSAIADGETGSVKLYAGPDAVVAYTTDKDLAVPEDPCASEDLLKSTGPMVSLSLPIGTNFLKAFTCPGDSSVPELFSYMLSTVVTVHPGYAPAEDDQEARVSASSIIELDPSAINNILGEDTATDYIALVWSKFAQAGVEAAGVSGTAVVTGVAPVTSPFRRLAQVGAEAGAQYKIDYEVITTASEASALREFLEIELVPGSDTAAMSSLSQILGGAKLVQQTTEVECSTEASKACEVEWAFNVGACMLDPLEDVSCGQVKQGFVLVQPGLCGAPCPATCTESLSCSEVIPCDECECSGNCGTKFALAEEADVAVDSGAKEAVVDEDVATEWWVWVAVVGGILLLIVGVAVAFVLIMRCRKRRAAEAKEEEADQNYIFSSAYEIASDASNDKGSGNSTEGEVHITVNTHRARSGAQQNVLSPTGQNLLLSPTRS